jgi:hypothetical protein
MKTAVARFVMIPFFRDRECFLNKTLIAISVAVICVIVTWNLNGNRDLIVMMMGNDRMSQHE